MGIFQEFFQLNTKRKFLAICAMAAWGFSIYFSKQGFALDAPNTAWLGWGLGVFITAVELAFNDRTQKQTITLTIAGIICYSYGIWTNVTGFWDAQNPGQLFIPLSQASLMSWFVGLILEILPEPLLMFALGRARESDPLGALGQLTSGKMNFEGSDSRTQQPQNQGKPNNNQGHKPNPGNAYRSSNFKPDNKQSHPMKNLLDEMNKETKDKPRPSASTRPLYSEPTYHPKPLGFVPPKDDENFNEEEGE